MSDQQKYTNKLEGKRIPALGGSVGIGYGVTEASLENAAKVFISSSNSKRIQASVAKLQEAYSSKAANISGFACDLSSGDVEANLVALFKQPGDLEHVILTAVDSLAGMSLEDLDIAKLKKSGQIRFFTPPLLAKHLPKSTLSYPLATGSISFKSIKNWSAIASYASGLR